MPPSSRLRGPDAEEVAAAYGVGDQKRAGRRPRRQPAAFGWTKEHQVYDPDKGYRAEDVNVPSLDYARRFYAAPDGTPTDKITEKWVLEVPGQGKYIPVGVGGQFLEWNREGGRFKPVMLNTSTALKQHRESQAGQDTSARLREAGALDFETGASAFPFPGQDASVLWDTEFIPIMAGPFYKQLYIYDYLYMHARAFEMVNHEALAAAIVKIMVRFALGRGVNFHIKHDKARAVWSEFWEANNMREKIRFQGRDLTWQGETMWKITEPRKGFVQAVPIDPSACWEIVTDPENIDNVYYYHFQYPTPYQIWITGKIPVAKYIIQQIPPTNIQHLKTNCSSQEKRGRSDLFAAMPWIKRYKDYYNGATVKAIMEANLVFILEVDGDDADVQRARSDAALTVLPPPGAVWVQNPSARLKPTSAQMTAGRGSSGIGQQLASTVACSVNLPGEYFNIEGQGAARATALVRTDPAVKTIEDRQQLHREDIERLYARVMATALLAGRIPREAAREEPDMTRDGWQDGSEERPEALTGEERDAVAGAVRRARVAVRG